MKTMLVLVAVAPLLIAQAVWCGTSGFFNSFTGLVIAGIVGPLAAGSAILILLKVMYGHRRSTARGWIHGALWWTGALLLAAGILAMGAVIGGAVMMESRSPPALAVVQAIAVACFFVLA